ncbi:MAG: CD1871A family CXXC motif-containing protein [Clostridia bacterium]|nr:CD1871A family CXXC motif-containing protein [Clostridia bacterium]
MRNRERLARAAAWLLALSTLLTAGLLIAQCIQIREAGAFSREIVRARLEGLAWAGALWLALLAATLLLKHINRKENPLRTPAETRPSAAEDRSRALAGKHGQQTAARFSAEAVPEETRLRLLLMRVEKTDAMRAEERRRRMARGVCVGICAGCAAMVARYLVNPANFTSRELEPVIGRMLWHIAPWILVGFACAILCERVCGRSFRREIELAARSPERATFDNAQTDSGASREKRACLAKTAARAAVFALAVALLALGAANGGMRDVLVKAINICTECIGLG